MATTMVPEATAAATPSAASTTGSDGLRFVAIRANLLPDEVVAARRADVMRKRVLAGLAVLALLLVGAYAMSWWETNSAQDKLDSVQRHGQALKAEQLSYEPLVAAQAQVASIQTQLTRLMANDLPWPTMINTLRSTAPSGLVLTQINGTITAAAAPGSSSGSAIGIGALNQTGLRSVGTLTVTGTAADKRAVADYADRLAKVKGLASPYITSVTVTDRTVTFALTALVTSDALGGRYSTVAPTIPGGK